MICIIDCGTSWLQEIKQNLSDLNHEFMVVKSEKIEDFDFKLLSGVIISGAPVVLLNNQEYLKKFNFLKSIKIPVLGICLGHQIMGLQYDSKIRAEKIVDKMEQIEILRENDLFEGIQNLSEFKEEHSEFISLPEDFILLAKSESSENESMKHKNKPLFGVQFHPEVSGNNGKKLFANFLKLC